MYIHIQVYPYLYIHIPKTYLLIVGLLGSDMGRVGNLPRHDFFGTGSTLTGTGSGVAWRCEGVRQSKRVSEPMLFHTTIP